MCELTVDLKIFGLFIGIIWLIFFIRIFLYAYYDKKAFNIVFNSGIKNWEELYDKWCFKNNNKVIFNLRKWTFNQMFPR